MNKLFTFLNSIFKKKSGYYVKIDASGASTAMNMVAFYTSPEGQKHLKDMKEFYEKYKGVPLND